MNPPVHMAHILNATQNYDLREGDIEESKSYWLWININCYFNDYYYNWVCCLIEKKPWLYLKNLTIFQNLLDYHNSYEKDQTITKYTMNYQNSKFHVPRGMVLDFRA